MDIHILQHEDHETAGHIDGWAKDNDHMLNVTMASEGIFPAPSLVRLLIVLGGALNVDDKTKHNWLADEKTFLNNIIERDCPVLGICLGSQLLAEALGAEIRVNSVPEIGWHHVSFDDEAMAQAGLSDLELPKLCLEWHSRTFDIPDSAVLLASSQHCKNQAFIANGRHVGLQFHPEWTIEILKAVAQNEPMIANGDNIQSMPSILQGDVYQSRPFLYGILDHLVDLAERDLS